MPVTALASPPQRTNDRHNDERGWGYLHAITIVAPAVLRIQLIR